MAIFFFLQNKFSSCLPRSKVTNKRICFERFMATTLISFHMHHCFTFIQYCSYMHACVTSSFNSNEYFKRIEIKFSRAFGAHSSRTNGCHDIEHFFPSIKNSWRLVLSLARGVSARGVGCGQTAVTCCCANLYKTCTRRTEIILLQLGMLWCALSAQFINSISPRMDME